MGRPRTGGSKMGATRTGGPRTGATGMTGPGQDRAAICPRGGRNDLGPSKCCRTEGRAGAAYFDLIALVLAVIQSMKARRTPEAMKTRWMMIIQRIFSAL